MSEVAIDAQQLARRYGRRWALAGVTFRLPAGTATMLVGSNGAGKTTLLRVLATAIHPDRGSVTVGGFDVVRHREDVRKLTALLAHQNYLYESLTARENLEVVADHLRISRERVMPLLQKVGLAARANDAMSTFSAGMRKRLSFARVLLQQPGVVLLDEPYGALDPPGFDLVDGVVAELKASGATIVMATHQWERSAAMCDRAIVLEGGAVIFEGSAAEWNAGVPPAGPAASRAAAPRGETPPSQPAGRRRSGEP
ncbi:MAG TPA: heme ABC exporter ATP-binding protein CcmA [Thermoanaerobaculia bacterium]|nr:heme ABC exporter ATP-binding protein CcmA [Thermoanaerobaculia bacterium]